MHSLFFEVKRAHRATLKLMNPLFARVAPGLTQARYDVLHTLDRLRVRYRHRQSDVWRALGLHPSTVCRLVRALVERGFVATRKALDRRQVDVRLTERGLDVLRRARRFLGKFVLREVRAALVYCCARNADDLRMELAGLLWGFRARFGDRAQLLYDPSWPPGAD